MKTSFRAYVTILTAMAAAAAMTQTKLNAQTPPSYSWTVADNFQYVSGYPSMAKALAADSFGNVYAAGYGVSNTTSKTTSPHAIVRGVSASGGSWTLLSDFVYAPGKYAEFNGIGTDPSGNVFVTGECADAAGSYHWVTRCSKNAGATWQTVDDYRGPAGYTAGAYGLLVDGSGTVYGAGWGDGVSPSSKGAKTSYVGHWVIRTSIGGATWSTADDFQLFAGGEAAAMGVVSNGANLFAVGYSFDQTGIEHSIVRRSQNGTFGSWVTVDDVTGINPQAIGVDGNGNVYMGGGSQGSWIVRRSKDNGTSWATVDVLNNQCDPSDAMGFAVDAYGNILSVGQYGPPGGTQCQVYWTARSSASGDPGTWVTTDQFELYPPIASAPRAVARNVTGVLFAAGYANGSPTGGRWLVRQAAP